MFAKPLTLLTAMTLNLHGYHPLHQPLRTFEDRSGQQTRAPSDIYYFTWNEVMIGHSARLNQLAGLLGKTNPDLVFLQEVGAGGPNSKHTCEEFTQKFPGDTAIENSAVRLQKRLMNVGIPYQYALACRGNTGWVTSTETFSKKRILERDPMSGSNKIVFDFNSNPYPNGMIVEGMAMLIRPAIQILWQSGIHVPIADGREDHFFQAALLNIPGTRGPTLAVNLHMGHKLRNFEHSVAIIQWIQETREKMKAINVIVGGDFNGTAGGRDAEFKESTLTMTPWEVFSPGRFDLRLPPEPAQRTAFVSKLSNQLFQLNFHSKFKAWATLQNADEAWQRVQTSVKKWMTSWSSVHEPLPLFQESDVKNESKIQSRVDYWFTSGEFAPADFEILNENADDYRTDTLSDHPFIYSAWTR